MNNGQNAARSRHLEELANAAKRYTLREILDVTEAVAAELGGLSSPNYDDFTGATSIAGGISGLVPAPQAGDESKFLRGDGVWATVESGSSGGAVDYVIGSAVSSVEGGFWQDTFNDSPVLKLRHGDYEYNFVYDNITYLGGASAPLVTVTPNTYVLGTASVSNDGGVWYEVNNDVPTLNLHKGNFNYSFNYDRITYRGDNSNLAAYLPLNVSPTMDACGNVWATTGNPTIVDGALYLDGSSYLNTSTPKGYDFDFTVDFWFTPSNISRDYCLFAASYQLLVSAASSTLRLVYDGTERAKGQIAITPGTRHHIAYAGLQSGNNVWVFIDGVLDITLSINLALPAPYWLGAGQNGEKPAIGSIDHFRVFRGQALWTSDFTPPTAEDYL